MVVWVGVGGGRVMVHGVGNRCAEWAGNMAVHAGIPICHGVRVACAYGWQMWEAQAKGAGHAAVCMAIVRMLCGKCVGIRVM